MSNFYLDVIKKDPRFHTNNTISDVALLEPGTRSAVEKLILLAHAEGYELKVAETFRSQTRQQYVFSKGWSKLKNVGCHGYGLACDLELYVDGKYIEDGSKYQFLVPLCKQVGLVSGIDWGLPDQKHTFHDWDHVQRITLARQNSVFNGKWYPAVDYNPVTDK